MKWEEGAEGVFGLSRHPPPIQEALDLYGMLILLP